MTKQITSGELIHRFRRKEEWEPGEWDTDLKRIVDTVTAEARADALAAERKRLVFVFKKERENRLWSMKDDSADALDWAIQQIEEGHE